MRPYTGLLGRFDANLQAGSVMVFQVRFHLSGFNRTAHTAAELPKADTNLSLPACLLLQLGIMRSVLLQHCQHKCGEPLNRHAVLVQPEDGWSARGSGPGDGELHPVLRKTFRMHLLSCSEPVLEQESFRSRSSDVTHNEIQHGHDMRARPSCAGCDQTRMAA